MCATALVVVIGAAAVWQLTLQKTPPPPEKAELIKVAIAPPDKISIAVLPFQNMTGDPQQEYLSDGMAEQLITGLSQTPDIYVTARTSSFAYRGKAMAAQQIAGQLGVRYLIEGSVQRDADRVRIHVQLIDGRNGEHVWAERYDRKFEDLFALQDQIAMEVMAAVNVKFSGFVAGSLKYSRPSSIKAYEYFLKGLHYHLGRNQKDVIPARQMFEEAIKLDPNYGIAYRWLGFVCLDEIYFRMTKSFEKSIEQAEQAAQKSWEVDPEHPPYALLSATSRTKRDFDNAILYAEKAVELDPNNAGNYFILGLAYYFGVRYEEAIENFETSLRLTPVRPPNYLTNLGRSYLGNKQYDMAILIFSETLERYPDFPGCWGGLTVAYELFGNHEKALWAAENIMRISPKFSLAGDEKSWATKDEEFKKRFYDALRSAGLK
jgi:adenylate cyclase